MTIVIPSPCFFLCYNSQFLFLFRLIIPCQQSQNLGIRSLAHYQLEAPNVNFFSIKREFVTFKMGKASCNGYLLFFLTKWISCICLTFNSTILCHLLFGDKLILCFGPIHWLKFYYAFCLHKTIFSVYRRKFFLSRFRLEW